MQDVSYYRFKYKKGEIVRLLSYNTILLLLIIGMCFFSTLPLINNILILAPLVILIIVNLIKYIRSMAVEYMLQDGLLKIKNKRNGHIKKVPISYIKYIKHYFTYTEYAERSYAYSKLIKVFMTNEIIEVYDTIQNSQGMILPEVLEKEFGIKIRHVHDSKNNHLRNI